MLNPRAYTLFVATPFLILALFFADSPLWYASLEDFKYMFCAFLLVHYATKTSLTPFSKIDTCQSVQRHNCVVGPV